MSAWLLVIVVLVAAVLVAGALALEVGRYFEHARRERER